MVAAGWWRGLLGACACAGVLLLAVSVPAASASLPAFCAGHMGGPTGVAVDQTTGDVYVLDRRNNRVDEFSGDCVFERAFGWDVNAEEPEEKLQTCTTSCQTGTAGSEECQLTEPSSVGGIAVDQATGDVYVLNNGQVEKFTGEGGCVLQFPAGGQSVAVGPTGTVYVGETGAVQEYGPEGKVGVRLELEGANGVTGLAINPGGELYVVEGFPCEGPSCLGDGETRPVRYYNASGVFKEAFDVEGEGSARAVTLDPTTGDVYVVQRLAPGPKQIRGFNPAGMQVSEFAIPNGEQVFGLAFDAQTGALYTPNNSNQVLVIVPPAPGPVVSGESVSNIEPTTAVVHAVINPESELPGNEASYHVEYGACASPGACAGTVYEHSVPVPEALLAPSFNEEPISIEVPGLSTRTKYHYRVTATDECEKTPEVLSSCETHGENSVFETLPPVLVEEEFSTDVRSTSATINATVNPLGSATGYHFLYGPCGAGECAAPVPDEAIGSGKTPVPVEAHLQGLTAGQTYHYHLIATNPLGEVAGPERAFTTQTGGEAGLPDGRAWELVSPPDKQGAQLFGAEEHSFTQAAANGDGVVYNASAPTESQPQGNGEEMQILARRTSTGWGNLDLASPHSFPTGLNPREVYPVFSADLSVGVLQPKGSFDPGLSNEATEQTPYLRDSTTGVFTPLVTAANDTTNPFIPFGEETAEGKCGNSFCGPEVRGATPDLSHVILGNGINEHTAPLLQGTSAESLYEWVAGKLALVSQLPENPPEVSGGPTLGGRSNHSSGAEVTAHAVSNDGSRIFWTETSATLLEPPLLFMRDVTRGETIEIGSGEADFEGANAAGTLVFYSGRECEILLGVKGLECKPVTSEGGEELEDGTVLTTSEDGTWVYFRQGGNIYARHSNETARLVASNIGNIRPTTVVGTVYQQEDPWRASPDGEWFAFMSDSPLTGYDNRDAVTGRPDEEVYLYNAAGGGRLVCASCDPTGARPHGAPPGHMLLADYAVHWGEEENRLLAASVPGWTPYASIHAVYDPRFLSDSGRLFFDAVGGLVPRDVNGQVDVYEFEPPGVGDCSTGTQSGTVVYSVAAGGCVALISSGESSEESVFADASESGGDVFFLSSSRLSTADLDGSLSLWDAHVCTGISPCLPAPSVPSPPCNTEASCKLSPTPQPSIFGAPASATFTGPGNPTPPSGGPKTAGQIRAEKLAKALKVCRRKHGGRKRRVCERHARRVYGARVAGKVGGR